MHSEFSKLQNDCDLIKETQIQEIQTIAFFSYSRMITGAERPFSSAMEIKLAMGNIFKTEVKRLAKTKAGLLVFYDCN